MGEKAATTEVINRLVSALGDKHFRRRIMACDALGKIGEKAATSEVINRLVSALGDKNSDVRASACDALVQMGEKAATSEVINRLMTALDDENSDVRSSVCDVLGRMGEKAATTEVINRLVSALGDKDFWRRITACDALGKIGEKAATSEVINRLLTALGNKDSWVRSRACYALGEMGEKAATSEVINRLMSALDGKDSNVRNSAYEALRKMGEKAATKPEQSWDGAYFREIILQQHVISFLCDPSNVLDTNEVIFLHDKAPCMKANVTQHLLEDENAKFWGNSIWPGDSPNMNPTENIGAIIKDKVEELMANEDRRNRYNYDVLKINLESTLEDFEDDTDLFVDLLCSMKKRFDALKAIEGSHTNF
ncbi:unnamed protein product [Rotaria sordida]|uniref:Clathrin/coatomer adaptor adaptin-like N-terminal domain-containing protein n=2 Tax=Rotaria sordida TaxID=392033 RepID=A0A813T578_9BILA|nr:unnamed protein product [Rotaria sordida]